MKTYSIKTPQGYLAAQGNNFWFQEEPKGWGEFTSAENAINEIRRVGYEGSYVIEEIS